MKYGCGALELYIDLYTMYKYPGYTKILKNPLDVRYFVMCEMLPPPFLNLVVSE